MNTFRQLRLIGALCGVTGLVVTQSASAQTNYLFTNFDVPGATSTTVNGISSNGTEVGFAIMNGMNANFLRSTGGAFTLLDIGDPVAGMANGVNSHNAVVGVANNNAFLLANGIQTAVIPPNSTSSIAFGINDAGKIVGQFVDAITGNTPGFLIANGVLTPFAPILTAAVTNVQGINNNDTAIGFYSVDGIHQHGFDWNIAANTTKLFADPNTARIAADGLVLTQFLGINDNNEAVGYYQTNNGSQFGFTYDVNTQTYTFLDDPMAAPVGGVQITQITGVDNKGDLSGFFLDGNGAQHGFFAAPTRAVPEPGSVALLVGLSLSGAGFLVRRRKHARLAA